MAYVWLGMISERLDCALERTFGGRLAYVIEGMISERLVHALVGSLWKQICQYRTLSWDEAGKKRRSGVMHIWTMNI